MSTSKILGGAQYRSFRERRITALKFYATLTRSGGAIGRLAGVVHDQLRMIHRMPNLSSQEKDHEFRCAIQGAAAAFTKHAGSAIATVVDEAGDSTAQPYAGVPAGPAVPGEQG